MKGMKLSGILVCALSFIFAAAIFSSCGGSGGGSGTEDSGTVALFATSGTGTGGSSLNTGLTSTATGTNLDSGGSTTNEGDGTGGGSLFSHMTATLTRIEIINKGSGASCTVLDESSSLGIEDPSGFMNFVAEAQCPAASYNRIHIEFGRDFLVEDKDGHESLCSFTSDPGMDNRPDVLQCSGSSCALDINGAVNVLMKQKNNLTLNFSLKEFSVQGFGTGACAVTLKTSPICSSQTTTEAPANLPEGITGLVSHITPSTQTFDLTTGHKTFTVLYSGITSSQQPGIEDVLQRAQDDALRLSVLAPDIRPSGGVIPASSFFFTLEGVMSNIDTQKGTCTMTYQNGKTMDIVYQDLASESGLKDGSWVQFTVAGYDGERFIASGLKTAGNGMMSGD